MTVKFKNTIFNRNILKELGYKIYDPHCTFNRKNWIIISIDGKTLLGVNRRNNFKQTIVVSFIEKNNSLY